MGEVEKAKSGGTQFRQIVAGKLSALGGKRSEVDGVLNSSCCSSPQPEQKSEGGSAE